MYTLAPGPEWCNPCAGRAGRNDRGRDAPGGDATLPAGKRSLERGCDVPGGKATPPAGERRIRRGRDKSGDYAMPQAVMR